MIHRTQHFNVIEISPLDPNTIFNTCESVRTKSETLLSKFLCLPLPKFSLIYSLQPVRQMNKTNAYLLNPTQSVVI